MNDEKIEFVESSGNIFADLGLPNPEERLAKAELARQIRKIITARDLTQAQAGAVLGIAQPNVSNLVRGRLERFSVDKLMDYLAALGQDVQIVLTPAADVEQRGEITVAVRSRPGRLRSIPGGSGGGMPAEPMAASGRETRERRSARVPVNEDLTKWLSTPQAAERAGVSRQMLNRLVRSGVVVSRRTPLGKLVNPASLQRYIEERRMRGVK